MHPDLYPLASELVRDRLADATRRRELLPQPRPPGRLRSGVAGALVRVAATVAGGPVAAEPRRRRQPQVAGRV